MTLPDDNYINIGKVGGTYGVQGWVKIHTYTEFGPDILTYQPWYLGNPASTNPDWMEISVENHRPHANGIIVKLKGFNTPEESKRLAGKTIAVKRSQFPDLPENEFYWSDLIGLTVIDQHNHVLGKVAYLIETGSNDVLVVKGEKEQAIPYLWGEVVLSIDLNKGEIHVNWELL